MNQNFSRTSSGQKEQQNPVAAYLPKGSTFAERTRTLRAFLGSSQTEFATLLGISSRQVSNWETGQDFPKFQSEGKSRSIPAYTKKLVSKLMKAKELTEENARTAVAHMFAPLRSGQLGKRKRRGSGGPEVLELRRIIAINEESISLQKKLIQALDDRVAELTSRLPVPKTMDDLNDDLKERLKPFLQQSL